MNRRFVITGAAGSLALAGISSAEEAQYTVAVIGHTGRGNFGHGLDKVWLQLPETKIVGVADEDEAGLQKAQKALQVDQGFADYRAMLLKLKPDIVAVCPRQPDQHAAMTLAAIASGAKGVYIEKPFVRTLEEYDQIKAAAKVQGTKIAVAHRNRYHPDLAEINQILQNEGDRKIGKWLEIRGRGKGDRRGGGEDLWVLGTHVLDLMAYFAGKPKSCTASIYEEGSLARRAQIKDGNEALGPLFGDEIHARFTMANGITAFWDSVVNDETSNLGFGLQLIGSEGSIMIHCDKKPLAHYRSGNPFGISNQSNWEVIGNTDEQWISQVHNHVLPCRDLIAAIEENREPVCGIEEAGTTIEMVMGVFASHIEGGKTVSFPLENRKHPLL